jgi:hypothetical protein
LLLWHVLRTGRFPRGIRAPAECQPAAGADARAEALRAALRRLAAHTGPLAEHPLGGPLGRAVWDRFHSIHCAHHLGFAIPTDQEQEKPAGGLVRG